MSWVSIIIDAVLALIALFFIIRGYKRGLIVEIIGVVAIVIAFAGANIVATTYSAEFKGLIEPFVGGIADKAISGTLNEDRDENGDLTQDEMSDVYNITYRALKSIGLPDNVCEKLASAIGEHTETAVGRLSERVTDSLSEKLAFVLVFAIVFILLTIIFAAIGNVINLAFNLPGLDTLNHVTGAVFGFCKGAMILLFIACVFRYLGIIVPESVTEKTFLLRWLTESNILAEIIGI